MDGFWFMIGCFTATGIVSLMWVLSSRNSTTKTITKKAWERYNEIQRKLAEPNRSKWNKKRLKHERVKLKTILGITKGESK
jgi:hypothetical protein